MNARARLLLVEFEEQVRGLLQTLLLRSGYDVRAVRTAEEALHVLNTSAGFEAVISEIFLPGMDGHELARHVAARFPASKVIFVTATCFDCGACPFALSCPWIAKPFVPKELVRRVSELLGTSPG